ncbi:hypothetical protein [Rodentibacter caecimuris]|uniref:hypothetical protein n=1 Tax=Rodentibacter caecimuris TaxID=1796644 RepID=UPI00224912C0|nr:hypothetical protein [Rodentibacter heylii]MCX2962427.1 hypothetical protein [Rodentibacter heylii]
MMKFSKFIMFIFLVLLILYFSAFLIYSKKDDECSVLWKINAISDSIACYEDIPFFIDSSAKIELFNLHVDERFGISDPIKGLNYISQFSLEKKREIIKYSLHYYTLKSDVREYLNRTLETMGLDIKAIDR